MAITTAFLPVPSVQPSMPSQLWLASLAGSSARSCQTSELPRLHFCATAAVTGAILVARPFRTRPQRLTRLAVTKRRAGLEEFAHCKYDDGCHYQILTDQVLGSGAQGTVYRGKSETGENVAIKVIPTWRLILEPGREEKLASIEEELGTLRTLGNHPNIAGLIGTSNVTRPDAAGSVHPHYKLVAMEVVEGRELAEHVALGGPMRESVARHIFLQVLDGLAHMHKRGVIHRDLKPENVMVTGETIDLESQVKLIDFGVAKCLRNGPLKTVVGTPSFMAPEVAKAKIGSVNPAANTVFTWDCGLESGKSSGHELQQREEEEEAAEEFCPKIDVWSAGICLYTCLTGKLPFRTEMEIIKSDYGRDPLEHCSEEAKDLLRSMLEKDPKKRFSIDECLAHPWVPCSEVDGCTINWDDLPDDDLGL